MLALAAKDRDTAKPAPKASPVSRASAGPDLAPAPAIAAPPGYFRDRLPVGAAGDPHERAADRTAEALTAPAPMKSSCPTCAGAGGQSCPTCGEKGAGGGAPLPGGLRDRFEGHLGADLGDVRLHTGPRASASALALNANAYAVGHDIVLGRDAPAPSTADGERLLAHEVAHTLQPGGAIRRDEAAGRGPDPDIEAIRSLLRDGDEEGALAAIGKLSDAQGRRALADDNLRAEAVSTFDDEEMAEAMRLISGHMLMKLQWLMAEDTTIFEAMPLVERSPQDERPGAYADGKLRDWFVEICGDVEMEQLVLKLGGRLIEQLRWMAAENSDWFPVYVILDGGGASAEERREVLESAEMRRFFQQAYGDYHVGRAVELLGGEGDLSLQMEWLQQEGSNVTPSNAQKRPQIASRDEALMGVLDRTTPLFQLFEAAEKARDDLISYTTARAASAGEAGLLPVSDPYEDQLYAQLKTAEAAFEAGLKKMGYADVAAFKEEFRRFEAFFHGFALQTAFQMLKENRALAERERTRMQGADMDAFYNELPPVWELNAVQEELWRYQTQLPSAGVPDPETEEGRNYAKVSDLRTQRDVLQAKVDLLMPQLVAKYPIIARKEEQQFVLEHAADKDVLKAHFQAFGSETIGKIDEVHEGLAADSSKIWKMPPVLDRAKKALGVVEGSAMDGIVRRKIAQVERDEFWEKLTIGALALGLGLLSMGTGTIAVLAGAGAFTISLWQVGESWDEYSFKKAAYGSALDLADALSGEDPSIIWLLIDIAGAIMDFPGLGKGAKAAAHGAAEIFGETAGKLHYATDARAAAEAALELEAKAARFGGDVQAAVRQVAQRELANRVALVEAPELVKRLKDIAPELAKDEEALAGLVRMGEAAAEAAAKTFANEPAMLQRLGRLCAQDPAMAMGAARLRSVLGDEAAAAILRDALLRRDSAFARRLLGATGDGHLTDDALRTAAKEGPAAAERELAAATGAPAPGTPEARAALESTAKLDGEPKNLLDLKNEWDTVQSSRGVAIEEGEYVAEVALPNGHKWKQRKGGGWCRFSDPFCLTDAGMKALEDAPVNRFAQALRAAETEAADAQKVLGDWPSLEARLRAARKPGGRTIDPDLLNEADRKVLEDLLERQRLKPRKPGAPARPEELSEATIADVKEAFERPPVRIDRRTGRPIAGEAAESEAEIMVRRAREAEAKALADLGASNRPLLDKLHDALRQKTKDRILSRAKKDGVAIDEFLGTPPPSGALDVDHIIPLDQIMEMPGFKALGWKDQAAISNAIGNLKAVDSGVNRSRQALSWTDQWAGRSLYTPDAMKAAVEFEAKARTVIEGLIDQATKNPGSLTMP